ncbi:polysaccharide biosynthesis protein [Frigidibacter sp. ROC022]|uniref:polysaccharide biosynthesis protein n=1 Tax=Frigidibacter sp. ROC022 TaxID=2971796 RepID=UPI00215B1679|nr:nucleoside-diphosphate sugar epimerase/dehydratase [Frigidibacter sp. ROC022]MCR8724183.1 polysaccharide biosynthesis protein [Frigidibacter sp. ROC022]
MSYHRGGVSLRHLAENMSRRRKRMLLLLADLLVINLSLFKALSLSLNRLPGSADLANAWLLFPALTLIGGSLAWGLGLPKIKLNAYDWSAILRTAVFASLMAVAGLAVDRVWPSSVPASLFYTYGLILFTISVLGRIGMLHALLWVYRRKVEQRRVLIYGAGSTGIQLAAALSTHDSIDPLAFVDDNPALRGLTISGVPVYGPGDLRQLIRNRRIDRVLLAMPQLSRSELSLKLARLQSFDVDVHAVPSFAQLAGEKELLRRIEPVSLEGLLGRAQIQDELPGARDTFAGRSVMVTGAGGSIGSELCRQLADCNPARIVLFDNSEPALYQIDRELRGIDMLRGIDDRTPPEIVAQLGSVTDAGTVRRVIAEYGVQTVLHTAAYKHVPLVEENPLAGLQNNVIGTRVVAEAARDMGLENFLLVSTDKAVRPKNMMGASKRMAELIVQDLATRATETRFSMVRFGNVLGSSGSVIPLFHDQIARGGPVTVTHDDVTRYFMTIPEAARLVLTAISFARGGDLFVLDMGEPVPIRRLAEQMIEGAGLTVQSDDNPNGDIRIVITGLRRGEKLHEELLSGPDRVTTPHPKILRAQEESLSEIEVATMLRDLQLALDASDAEAARKVVLRWIRDNAFDEAPGTVVFSTQPGQ